MHFNSFLIGFLDELHVKTKCGSDAGSSDKLIVTLCQDARCCTTGSIQMENGADDCSITDIFENESLLGTCTDSYFKLDSVYGSLTYSDHSVFDTDNWRGEWMTIMFTDGNYLDCQIEGWVGSNNMLDFSCSPGGIKSVFLFLCKDELQILSIISGQIVELEIRTSCEEDAGTSDALQFVFCQNDQCCSTNGLGLSNGNIFNPKICGGGGRFCPLSTDIACISSIFIKTSQFFFVKAV